MRRVSAIGLCLLFVTLSSRSVAAQASGVDLKALFTRLDANHDQVIEKSEVPESALPAFEKLLGLADTNHNGKIEADELRELARQAPSDGDPAERFKNMDKNGDGKISRDEFQGRPARFDVLDKDKDGSIDKDELKSVVAQARRGAGLKAMDKDGDGKLSRSEFAGPARLFHRLDADSDGQISKDEAARAASANYQRLTAMDKNGDGKLSRDEFRGLPARFDALDRNKDGFIDFQEIPGAPKLRDGSAPKANKKP